MENPLWAPFSLIYSFFESTGGSGKEREGKGIWAGSAFWWVPSWVGRENRKTDTTDSLPLPQNLDSKGRVACYRFQCRHHQRLLPSLATVTRVPRNGADSWADSLAEITLREGKGQDRGKKREMKEAGHREGRVLGGTRAPGPAPGRREPGPQAQDARAHAKFAHLLCQRAVIWKKNSISRSSSELLEKPLHKH